MTSRRTIAALALLAFICSASAYGQTASSWSPWSKSARNHFPMEGNYLWRGAHTRGGERSAIPSRALVLLGEYGDVSFLYSSDYFRNMLTKEGYSFDGATGCAQQYIREQFGTDDFTIVLLDSIITAPKPQKYYAINTSAGRDEHPGEFIADICRIAAEKYKVDFSSFDEDGDGYVDNVFVFFAGEDEAQIPDDAVTARLWSHHGTLKGSDWGKELAVGNVKVNAYSCASEIFLKNGNGKMTGIGTFCHEYFHNYGLSDMYDTDYDKSGGTAAGLWKKTSLMDAGNYNNDGNTPPNLNAVEREILGILVPEELKPGKHLIFPIGSPKAVTYRISNPSNPDEYYLIENRKADENTWDAYIGGSGLLVYHIDKSDGHRTLSDTYARELSCRERWIPCNEVNCRPDHQCADLIEADGRSDVNPASWDNVSGIFFPQVASSSLGGDSDIKLSFRDSTFSSLCISAIGQRDSAVVFTVTDLFSPVPPAPVDPVSDEDPLYIIIKYSARVDGISIPSGTVLDMYVSNDVGVKEIQWYFSDVPIPDPTAFVFTAPGVVSARITRQDGSIDYLFKELLLK